MAVQDEGEPTRVKGAEVAGRASEEHPSQETGRYGCVGDPCAPTEAPASPSHVQESTPAQPLDKSVYCRQPPLRPAGPPARTGQAPGARRHPSEPGRSREQVCRGAARHGLPAGTWAVDVGDSHPPSGSTLPVIAFIRLLDSKDTVRQRGLHGAGRSCQAGPRQPPRPARLPAAPEQLLRDGEGARGKKPGGPCLRNPLEPQAGRWSAAAPPETGLRAVCLPGWGDDRRGSSANVTAHVTSALLRWPTQTPPHTQAASKEQKRGE